MIEAASSTAQLEELRRAILANTASRTVAGIASPFAANISVMKNGLPTVC